MAIDRVFLLTTAVVALSGCGGGVLEPVPDTPSVPETASDEQAVGTCLGNWVTFPCNQNGSCLNGCGQQIACLDNEKVRSNKNSDGSSCGVWTCVELAERYWACHKNVDIVARVGLVGKACNLCTITPNGWTRHTPWDGYLPVRGDLLVQSCTTNRPDGHVAVIKSVSGSFMSWTANVVEQNKSCSGTNTYTMSQTLCILHPSP